MGWLHRLANLFQRDRIGREIEEELQSHLAEAMENGRSPEEARRALGGILRYGEQSRDIRFLPFVESLVKDVAFGWRQLKRNRTASAAAILSLALAIGSATTAFRIVDALLLRPLPVAHPERLSVVAMGYLDNDGRPDNSDEFDYLTFRKYREALAGRADVLGIGLAFTRENVVFSPGAGPERICRQYVSGNVFGIFGLRPALGRLLTPNDDLAPRAQPAAVLSYEFWTRRFGRDPNILGKTFRMQEEGGRIVDELEIVGVAPPGFTGTDPGLPVDIFVPTMMNAAALDRPGWGWLRIWVRPKPGVSLEQVRQPLQAVFSHDLEERMRGDNGNTPRRAAEAFLQRKIILEPASAGASRIQKEYRRPLLILTVLVGLVLLLACANAGNLLTAQATARAREMALRVSLGAGQRRLLQLVLVESAMLAGIASLLGTLFAWWAAPFLLPMLHVPGDPVRLVFDAGWRQVAFSLALVFAVTLLFGLAPALRASAVQPMSAIRGGQNPHARRRMNLLLAAQMAFCVLVQFVAGLFVSTFQRLSTRPLGFSYQHVLVSYLEERGPQQSSEVWMQAARRMAEVPGVESVAMAGWPLLEGDRWTRTLRFPGRDVEPVQPYCLDVSPGFFETLRIGRINGRDFRADDKGPRFDERAGALPGVGIVNEAFARAYFGARDPVGRSVGIRVSKDAFATLEIIGYVRDAAYASLREQIKPVIYVPQEEHAGTTLLVRTAGDPMALAQTLRREVARARPDFEVHQVFAGTGFLVWQMIRERLLALLSAFFAMVALALAAIGLYGVLNYSVTERRREIGIRMAIGAGSVQVVWRISAGAAATVALGAAFGIAAGMASGRFFGSLLYEVQPTDAGASAMPLAILLAAAVAAALPPAIRATRIDPARTLRSE